MESSFPLSIARYATDVCSPQSRAGQSIFEYIEVWYNRERRHSTLGYLSPVTYEARLRAA
jgi:transposase InsO family protein